MRESVCWVLICVQPYYTNPKVLVVKFSVLWKAGHAILAPGAEEVVVNTLMYKYKLYICFIFVECWH